MNSKPLTFAFSTSSLKMEKMKIFFVDISGSTGYGNNRRFYHSLSKRIYDSIKDHPHIIVGWDEKYRVLTDAQYMNIVSSMKGFDGTSIDSIGSYLMTLSPQDIDIIILTDGEVSMSSISLCDNIMQNVIKNIKINSVSAFISSCKQVNCSVLAPFLRGDWSSSVFHDSQTGSDLTNVHFINTQEHTELLDLVKTATTEDQINAVYDRLVSLLTAMTMGKSNGDPQMRDLILKMFNRIKDNIKKDLSRNSILADIQSEFNSTKNIAVDSFRKLMNWYTSTFHGKEFQTKIDFLLEMCDGKLSNLFDPQQIRMNSLQRATVNTTPQSDVQLAQIVPSDDVTPIQCPIMLDDSANMIVMINRLNSLFSQIDKSMQDMIMSNTFYATALVDLIKKYLDHSMSVKGYVSLPNKNESPMTRNKISCCLVLGADDVSVKATNHAIGIMVLGKSGIIGNPDIWFYVIYHVIKSGNAPWLEAVLPMFENQLRYRMTHSNCCISMSGFPKHVQLKTTFGVALRFVLSQVELDMKKDQSSFPIFSGSSHHIVSLLKMFGCDLPDTLLKYCTVVHQLGKLVNEIKQLHLEYFSTKYRALIGNFYTVDHHDLSDCVLNDAKTNGWLFKYVPLDGSQTNLPDFARDMTDEMRNLTYNLSQLIIPFGESTTTFTILDTLNYNNIHKLFETPTPLENDWKLYQHPFKYNNHIVVIHPHTMRPTTVMDGDHWKSQFEKYFNGNNHFTRTIFDKTPDQRPSGDVFNGCSMYGNFVNTYKIHPTLSDFVLYCFTRCKNSQYQHKTIPFVEFCQRVINFYDFSRTIPIDEFITKYNNSCNRDARIKIEQSNPL